VRRQCGAGLVSLEEEGDLDTDKAMWRQRRDQRGVSVSQGTPGMAGNLKKLGEAP
jgi:hypothetical protein